MIVSKENYNKVASITLLFWLQKIVATTLGETLGDYISMTLHLGYTVAIAITLVFFISILAIQLNAKNHIPLLYWGVIVGTTTLGTELSDFMDRTLNFGYALGSLLLVICLLVTLFFWYKKYNTLEVFPIAEKAKESYYWIAILFSNSLGTAFGDFLSDNLGLQYLYGAALTGAIILIVVGLHYFTKINQILLFWIAFVFTRPFGATFGDFLTKPIVKGGLALGTLPSSLVAVGVLLLLVFFSKQRSKQNALT